MEKSEHQNQTTANVTHETLKYYWQKACRYPWLLSLFFIMVIWAIAGQHFVTVWLYKDFIDLMANATEPVTVVPQALQLIIYIGVVHALCTFAGWRAAGWINDYFQPWVMRDIEQDCFNKLQHHSHSFFANNFSGALVTKANRFVRSFEMVADIIQWNVLGIIVRFVGSFAVIYYFLPQLAWIFLAWTVVYIICCFLYVKYTRHYWEDNATKDSTVTGQLADVLTNILNIKMFSRKTDEEQRFGQTITNRQLSRTLAWHTGEIMRAWQAVLMISFEILLMYMMLMAWSRGEISIGTVFAIQTFVWTVFISLWELGRLFQDYNNALADAKEMTEIMLMSEEIKDPLRPEPCRIKKGKIQFDAVGFRYEQAKDTPTVFADFNLTIPAGQKIGLVGESGAGKSTFVNLLLRFMDLSSGEIKIDGQNISHITQDDLRRGIAYVPQEPILFHRSLWENIKYGKPTATKAEITQAAINAHALDFIMETPEKWQTLVGERGVKLSGGQKQRVALARAMLKDSPILILDEATSALDSKAEVLIQQALEKLMEDRTTIVIAHRLSTLRQMDRIIVMDAGEILEDGTHDELIERNGKYAELWKHQSGGFIS